jgi:glyoxylase-like metal-dependent hydrolase (beta-lactamase superfamily II)
MTTAQAERPNYTTRPGLAQIRDSGCARPVRLDGGPLMPVPGFPGVFVIDAGGHTPGSQIVLAQVGSGDVMHRYAFVGDIVNNRDGIEHDIPKPWVYRTFIVPESETRQEELRRFLKRIEDEAGTTPMVSHDQLSIERSGVEAWH